jgi:hypothetical protein
VPITILRARPAAARLFFGKIGGGRGLVRSHFFSPVNEKPVVAQAKLRAAILPWVFLGFVSTQSQAVNVEAPRQRGASELSVSPALRFWRRRVQRPRPQPGSSASTHSGFRLHRAAQAGHAR